VPRPKAWSTAVDSNAGGDADGVGGSDGLLQIADVFKEGKKDATLQQDDTTKRHQAYSAFEASYLDDDGKRKVLTLGIKESYEKGSDGVARTFARVLEDVELATSVWKGKEMAKAVRVSIVASLANTMTDRGSLAVCFGRKHNPKLRLCELLKADRLPDFLLDAMELSESGFRAKREAEQLKLMVTRNFACNDHYMVTQSTDVMVGLALCGADAVGEDAGWAVRERGQSARTGGPRLVGDEQGRGGARASGRGVHSRSFKGVVAVGGLREIGTASSVCELC
jgi:hypothetical protein